MRPVTVMVMAEKSEGDRDLFGRLRDAVGADWDAHVGHRFVRGLADGSLPEAAFRHYLVQDYLFLIQLARAYALAAYKADDLAEMRGAAAMIGAVLDNEMQLHLDYCAEWGLTEREIRAADEDLATTAYTRFVLERGLAGDALDLHVALAPCVIGYGEIGRRLAGDRRTRLEGNPYIQWVETYGGDAYQGVAEAARAQLDDLARSRGAEMRLDSLTAAFRQATRLEVAFWEMGLGAADGGRR